MLAGNGMANLLDSDVSMQACLVTQFSSSSSLELNSRDDPLINRCI